MLRIHEVMLEVLVLLRPVLAQIARKDRNLEAQCRRAATSVVLNIAEGSAARGGNRPAKYAIALGEANEVVTALRVAVSFGYIAGIDDVLAGRLRQVVGTLVNVSR